MKAVLMVHLLFAAVLLSLGLEAANFQQHYAKPNTSSSLEIKKFVETPEPIWTYNSTLGVSFRCKVDVMSVCTENVIQFNRTHYINHRKQTRALKGLFRPDRKDQMFVRMLGTRPWYDLRIKNSSVVEGPSEDCSLYFNKTAGAGKPLYSSDCQAILQQASVTRRDPV
nr:uncharacterized protein LOC126534930 isoform X2 [Dermacentor andersoni]